MEKKVVQHIHDNLSDFSSFSSSSSSDDDDESDEKYIKAIQLMFFENVLFEGAISKMLCLREQF